MSGGSPLIVPGQEPRINIQNPPLTLDLPPSDVMGQYVVQAAALPNDPDIRMWFQLDAITKILFSILRELVIERTEREVSAKERTDVKEIIRRRLNAADNLRALMEQQRLAEKEQAISEHLDGKSPQRGSDNPFGPPASS